MQTNKQTNKKRYHLFASVHSFNWKIMKWNSGSFILSSVSIFFLHFIDLISTGRWWMIYLHTNTHTHIHHMIIYQQWKLFFLFFGKNKKYFQVFHPWTGEKKFNFNLKIRVRSKFTMMIQKKYIYLVSFIGHWWWLLICLSKRQLLLMYAVMNGINFLIHFLIHICVCVCVLANWISLYGHFFCRWSKHHDGFFL